MENAAIFVSSWQRPPMLIDPYEEGLTYAQWLSKAVYNKRPVTLDMDTRYDFSMFHSIFYTVVLLYLSDMQLVLQ